MTSEQWVILGVAAIGLVGSLASTLVTLIVALRTSRKVDAVQKATDGMKDALVLATDKAATEKGKAAGVEKERARVEKKP